MGVVGVKNAEHYRWGDGCDGWHLLKMEGASVIQEKVPPGKSEIRHVHSMSEQFFYILEGSAIIETEGNTTLLHRGEGMHIRAGEAHQFRNESKSDVEFLVISVPPSHGDRQDLPSTAT